MVDNNLVVEINEALCEKNAAIEITEIDKLMGNCPQFINYAECTHVPEQYDAPSIFFETDNLVYKHLINLGLSMLWKKDENDYAVKDYDGVIELDDLQNISIKDFYILRDNINDISFFENSNYASSTKSEGLMLDKFYKYKSYKSTIFLKGIPDFKAINHFINAGGIVNEKSLEITIMYYVGNLKNSGIKFSEFDNLVVDEDRRPCVDIHDYMDYLYWVATKPLDDFDYTPNGFGMKIRNKTRKDMIEKGICPETTEVQGMTFKNNKEQNETNDLLAMLPEWKLEFYNMRWDKEDKLYNIEEREANNIDLFDKNISEKFAVNPCNFPGSNYPNEDYLTQESKLNIHMNEYEVQKLMYPHLRFEIDGTCINPQDDFKPNASINRYKYRICAMLTDYEKDQLTAEEMFYVQCMKDGKMFPSWEMNPVLPIPYNKDIKFKDVEIDFEKFITLKDIQKVAYLDLKFDNNGKCLNIENIGIPNQDYNRYKYRMMETLGPRELHQMTIDEKITYVEYMMFGYNSYVEKMQESTNLSLDEINKNYLVIQKNRLKTINQFADMIKDIEYDLDFEDTKEGFERDILCNETYYEEEKKVKIENKKTYLKSKHVIPKITEFDLSACISNTR